MSIMNRMCRAARLLLMFCLLFLATSCADNQVEAELARVETLIWEQPDSALHVLEDISLFHTLQGKEQADYALLMTQAKYRCDIAAPSDSLINIAVAYYADRQDVDKKAASLFYKGAVLEELNDDERAMLTYKQAESCLPHIQNARLRSRIYFNLAALNEAHGNYLLAIDYYKKTLKIDDSEQYLTWKVAELINLGSIYHVCNNDSENVCFSQALEMLPLVDSVNQANIYYNLARYNYNKCSWDSAENHTLRSLAYADKGPVFKSCALLAEIYARTNRSEKTDSLWSTALNTRDIATRARIYFVLYTQAVQKKECTAALHHLEQYVSAADSFRMQTNQVKLTEIQHKYDQAVLHRQNAETTGRFYASVALLVLVLIVGAGLCYVGWLYYRRRMKDFLARNMQKSDELRQTINNFQLKMEEDETLHNDEKDRLLIAINALKQEKTEMDKKVNQYKAIIGGKDKGVNVSVELIEGLRIVCQIKSDKAPFYNPDSDRDKLHALLDVLYSGFASRMTEQYALTQRERDICYLKALSISDNKIANLLKLDIRSVDRNVSRIRTKAGFKSGREEFTDFIYSCLSVER